MIAPTVLVAAILGGLFPSAPPSPPPPVQTPGSNVKITTCLAQLDPPPLRIGFVNEAPKTATEIRFSIVTNFGPLEPIVDRGSFASGQSINHVFALPPGVSPLGLSSARCVVTQVIYADGTSWLNASLTR